VKNKLNTMQRALVIHKYGNRRSENLFSPRRQSSVDSFGHPFVHLHNELETTDSVAFASNQSLHYSRIVERA